MKLLIVYATLEGQTRKIAEFVADEARRAGHEVALFDSSDKAASVSFDGIDKVVLAASVHERRHPVNFEMFLAAYKDRLADRDTLLMSVSLSAAFPEGQEDARDYVDEMMMRTDFTPGATLLVAGAVQTKKYDYYAAQVVRYVVLRGREYDPEQDTHEFTDWAAVSAALTSLLDRRADRGTVLRHPAGRH